MNINTDAIRQCWQQREPREQKLLAILFLCFIGAALYLGIFKSIVGGYFEIKEEYQQADNDYRWFQNQTVALNQLKTETGGVMPSMIEAGELKSEIEKEFERARISAVVEVVSKGQEELVEIDVRSVSGKRLMRWLETMSNRGRTIHTFKLINKGGKLSGTILINGK